MEIFVAHLLDLLSEEDLNGLIFSDLLRRFQSSVEIIGRHGHLLIFVEKVLMRPFNVDDGRKRQLFLLSHGIVLLLANAPVVFCAENRHAHAILVSRLMP